MKPGLRPVLQLTRPQADSLRLTRLGPALSGLTVSPARAVFPLLWFKDPAGLARLAVEGAPGGWAGQPGDREDDPDAAAHTAGLSGRGARRHEDRMIAAGGPPAAPDADDVGRVVAEAQLPVRWCPPPRAGDRDLPDEPALPFTHRLVLHDRPLPARGRPARAGNG